MLVPDKPTFINTVLGPLTVEELGPTAVHESLLSVYPGAQYAPEISLDRSEIFHILQKQLTDFYDVGGRTIVDASGMFHGRDLPLLENLAKSTKVNIIASTGLGPEEMLGGYFLTPQTNPPTPWPAEKFEDLFSKEITEGMVVPRVERRAPAGLIATLSTRSGMTATDESLLRGAARAAVSTGVALSHTFGDDVLQEIDIILNEGLSPDRLVIRGGERHGAPIIEAAHRGVFIGLEGDCHEALSLLIDADLHSRIILSAGATGVAKGHAPTSAYFSDFMKLCEGLDDALRTHITIENPRTLLAVR